MRISDWSADVCSSDLQSLTELAATRETLLMRKGEEEDKAAELNEPLVNHAEHVEQARAQVNIAREQMRALREAAEAVETVLQAAIEAARAAESDKDSAIEKLQQARLEFENLRAHRESLEEQIAETGFERAVLFEGLDPEATLTDWEEKLATAVRRIERLGAINLAAIQELEEAQARETYMGRSEETRVGKEWVRTCRPRGGR